MEPSAVVSVCYHYPSLDTIFGLAYLKHYFDRAPQYTYNYYQVNHRVPFETLNIQASERLYFVGIVPKLHLLVETGRLAEKVIILDNKSEDAEQLSAKLRDGRLKRKVQFQCPPVGSPPKSVFQVCREYIPETFPFPQMLTQLASYVQDAEQFRFHLPRSREVASGLYALLKVINPTDVSFLETFSQLTVEDLISMGHERYEKYQQMLDEAMQETPKVVFIEKREDLCCLCFETENKMIKSELGHRLAEMSRDRGFLPVGIVAHSVKGNYKNLIALSFRSTDDYDVSAICRRNGGGGYKQAAQCRINRIIFENQWVQPEFF